MSEQTLLEMVQSILTDINGDVVNSISDTEEAEQVAHHIKVTYQNLMSNSKWDHTRRLVGLTPYSNSSFPTHMYLTNNIKSLISINYNVADSAASRREYRAIKYLEPDAFLMKINKRDNTKDDVDIIVDVSGVELLIVNDKQPEYYTSFDDKSLVFDSYNKEVDTTLQESKVQAWAYIIPEFSLTNSFVPDLPTDLFSLLVEEATSRCQFKMREMADGKSEQEASRQRRWASRESWRAGKKTVFPDYGRKRNRRV